MKDEWADGAQMEVASDLGGLVSRRVLGFGGRVRGGKPSTNEKPRTFGEWTMCKWEVLRAGRACLLRQAQHNACGGLWVLAGVSVGGNRPRMKNHDDEWTMREWESLRAE